MKKTDILNGGDFDFLRDDAVIRSKGATLGGLHISNDLGIIPAPFNILKKVKSDLKVIHELLESTAYGWLNRCTGDQLKQIAKDHPVDLMCPQDETRWFRIEGFDVGPDHKWYACADEGESHEVGQLYTDDLLALLETVEKVLYTNKIKEA